MMENICVAYIYVIYIDIYINIMFWDLWLDNSCQCGHFGRSHSFVSDSDTLSSGLLFDLLIDWLYILFCFVNTGLSMFIMLRELKNLKFDIDHDLKKI